MANASPWQAANHWVEVSRRATCRRPGRIVRCGHSRRGSRWASRLVRFLDLEQPQGPLYPAVRHTALPRYPGSWQDFSLVWDVDRGFAGLEDRLQGFSHPLVTGREFLYAYKGKGMPAGKGSYTYRFWLGAPDRTLSSDEIEQFRTAWLAFLEAEGIALR